MIERNIDARIDARLDAVAVRLGVELARQVVELLRSAVRADVGQVPPLLTVTEAAQRLSLSRSTVYELIRRGEIVAVKIGGARRIEADSLKRIQVGDRVVGRH